MIKQPNAFTRVLAVMVAAGCCGGLIARSERLLAQEPRKEKTVRPPDPWIGKKVVTKYSAPVGVGAQKPGPDRVFRVYTVQQRVGDRLQLVSESASGWIEATKVVPIDEATDFYSQEIRAKPTSAAAYHQRGLIWKSKGETDKAIADFTDAVRLDPKDASLYADRGGTFHDKDEIDKAIADQTAAISIRPKSPLAYNNRAWIWATCPDEKYREAKKAVESATKACELTKWHDPQYMDTLAAAHAEASDFASAVKWQTKANELRDGPVDRAPGEARLKLYQENKPYRDGTP